MPPRAATTSFDKPVDNIGTKTIPDYAGLRRAARLQRQHSGLRHAGQGLRRPAQGAVRRQPGRDLRPGQRRRTRAERFLLDPSIKDAAPTRSTTRTSPRWRSKCRRAACRRRQRRPVIGGWTTASVRQGQLLSQRARRAATRPSTISRRRLDAGLAPRHAAGQRSRHRPARQGQVQRLASRRTTAQFADYVTNPTLPALLEIALATPGIAPTNFPRTDLVTTFLTGIPGVNQPSRRRVDRRARRCCA